MPDVLENRRFRHVYERLVEIPTVPSRSRFPNVFASAEAAAAEARRLATLNALSEAEGELLVSAARAAFIGKISGMTHPEAAIEVLEDCQLDDPLLFALVRLQDTVPEWYSSHKAGEDPGLSSWRRLTRAVPLPLLALHTAARYADLPDVPIEEISWFIAEAQARGHMLGLRLS